MVLSLLLQYLVCLEVFVQQVTTVHWAPAYHFPAHVVFTWMILEEKAKTTANHALLVNRKQVYKTILYFRCKFISVKDLLLLLCIYQDGSRICLAKESVFPVPLGSTASLWVLVPQGGAQLVFQVLFPVQLGLAAQKEIQTVSLSLAP